MVRGEEEGPVAALLCWGRGRWWTATRGRGAVDGEEGQGRGGRQIGRAHV